VEQPHYYYSEGFIWYQDNNKLSGKPQINTNVDESIVYNYGVRQYYTIQTIYGDQTCLSDLALIPVSVEMNLIIPNVITPYNGIGMNDDFMVGKDGKPGYKVEIYNRYQQKIHEGDNGWDGTYRGQLAEPSTYYYRLFLKNGKIQKGTLEVAKF